MIAQQVAELPDDVTEAIKEREVTLTEARRKQKKAKARKAPPLPLGTYRVLYADPPWKYGDQLTENGDRNFKDHFWNSWSSRWMHLKTS